MTSDSSSRKDSWAYLKPFHCHANRLGEALASSLIHNFIGAAGFSGRFPSSKKGEKLPVFGREL